MNMVSTSYTDARGNEHGDIENLLRVYFLRQNRIALLPKIEEITIYDDTAGKIVMTVGMAGTNDRAAGFQRRCLPLRVRTRETRRRLAADFSTLGRVG